MLCEQDVQLLSHAKPRPDRGKYFYWLISHPPAANPMQISRMDREGTSHKYQFVGVAIHSPSPNKAEPGLPAVEIIDFQGKIAPNNKSEIETASTIKYWKPTIKILVQLIVE